MLVPELVQLAESTSDAAQLQQQLAARLADQYLWLAQTQQRLGHHARAVVYFSEALSHRPGDAASLRGRAGRTAGWARPIEPVRI